MKTQNFIDSVVRFLISPQTNCIFRHNREIEMQFDEIKKSHFFISSQQACVWARGSLRYARAVSLFHPRQTFVLSLSYLSRARVLSLLSLLLLLTRSRMHPPPPSRLSLSLSLSSSSSSSSSACNHWRAMRRTCCRSAQFAAITSASACVAVCVYRA